MFMFMEPYIWAKALHLIAIILWIVGLLCLPRLYAYHSNAGVGSDSDAILKNMERRLLRHIMNPAIIATFILGVWLVIITGIGAPGTGKWIHVKLLLVLVMAGAHGLMAKYRKDFEKGKRPKSDNFFRTISLVLTLLIVITIFLAVLKPF